MVGDGAGSGCETSEVTALGSEGPVLATGFCCHHLDVLIAFEERVLQVMWPVDKFCSQGAGLSVCFAEA